MKRNPGIITVNAGQSVTIAAGGSFDVQFTVTPAQPGQYSNIATLDPDNCVVESNETNNSGSDTVQVGSADLTLTKTHPQDPYVWYNLGCSYALTERHDEAFAALGLAFDQHDADEGVSLEDHPRVAQGLADHGLGVG